MVSKILKAVQSTLQSYPNAVQQAVASVRKALDWLNRQPFGSEVKALYQRISFTVDLGSFPELGTQRFTLSKRSGDTKVYGGTERNSQFELSVDGLIASAKAKSSVKRGEATAKASEAKAKAEEAQRLALEAARLAELAEAEADTFEAAVSGFANARR